MRIYTDASTRGQFSGIAFVVTDSRDREIYKHGIVMKQVDNNTAELCAVLLALKFTVDSDAKHITILTDSEYVIHCVRNGSRRNCDKDVVQKIREYMIQKSVSLMWIKGHQHDGTVLAYYNKRADKMSKVVRKQYEKQIKGKKKERMKLIKTQRQRVNVA